MFCYCWLRLLMLAMVLISFVGNNFLDSVVFLVDLLKGI